MKIRELLDSNRPGHLAAAIGIGALVISYGAVIGSSWWMGVGCTVIVWEWFATPDVDLCWQRRPKGILWRAVCALWLPYSWLVPHRSRFSHSLLFGLSTRLAYVFGMVTLLATLTGHAAALGRLVEDADVVWMIVSGCAIADTVHMLKDNYRPFEILWGK